MNTKPPVTKTKASTTPGANPIHPPVIHRAALAAGRWSGVEPLHYKQEGSAPFRDVSRQVLFGDAHMSAQLRYFEVQADGYTTLERHQHTHRVPFIMYRGKICKYATGITCKGTSKEIAEKAGSETDSV